MYIYSKVKRKENTDVPTLKLQQESDKTCSLIAALTMIE